MKLSFLILGYKDTDLVRLCLKNIYSLDIPFEFEVIYVDNPGGANNIEVVEQNFPQVRLFKNEANIGHPAGNNTGLRVAEGEYILMINPDIIIRDPQELQTLIDYMDENKEVAFLGPRLHNPDGSIQTSCYRKYSKMTPVYRRTFLGKTAKGKKDIARHLMTDFDHNETKEVEWLLGACMLIRRSAMEEIGLMDEEYFLYFGDYEWCDRAWNNGWKVMYYHDIDSIFHYHKRESATSRFSLPQVLSYVTRIHITDWLTYLRKQK